MNDNTRKRAIHPNPRVVIMTLVHEDDATARGMIVNVNGIRAYCDVEENVAAVTNWVMATACAMGALVTTHEMLVTDREWSSLFDPHNTAYEDFDVRDVEMTEERLCRENPAWPTLHFKHDGHIEIGENDETSTDRTRTERRAGHLAPSEPPADSGARGAAEAPSSPRAPTGAQGEAPYQARRRPR